MQDQDLLFYDIEVYSEHDAFVVFKDINKKLVRVFKNNFAGLADLIKGKTLIGFNNYFYDDKILVYMLEQKPVALIKQLNDKIINGENVRYINKHDFRSLDVFQQIDVSMPSLKKICGSMGRMILESSVPFDIGRPLNDQEYHEALHYCMNDTDATIDIYKKRIESYFKPKHALIDMLGDPKAIRWNTTTISANLLLKKPLVKWADIRIPDWMMDLVPEDVKELWLVKKKGIVNMTAFDCDIQWGFGGLHGAHKTIKRHKNVKLLDVASMYPNIILILQVLGSASEKYKEILLKRLAVKYSNPILSDALKLILNSVFGNLGNQYSLLFNPMACLSVCIYGQIALFELCKFISPYCTILNINTDGVAFVPHDDHYVEAYKQFEVDFGLQLEEKNFDLLIQKDVNNYIAVSGEKMICKGGDVNRYLKDEIFKNNNARILDIALVNHLVYGHDVLDTLYKHLDQPHLYQYILKAGNTYKSSCDQHGRQYNKVNRVFASQKEGFCLYKQRHDNGLVRFADAPIHMFLWNEDCSEIEDFESIVDLDHYYQIVNKRLERWI